MSGLVTESSGETLEGTDQALSTSRKPAVEVTFEVAKPGDGRALRADDAKNNRIAIGIRKMRERDGRTSPAPDPLKVEPMKPAEKADPPKPEAKPAAAKPALPPKVEAPKPVEPAKVEAEPEVEPIAEPDAEEPPTEEAKPTEQPANENKPDPVELASLRTTLSEREREMATLRADLERARGGGPSDDERNAYIENPLAELKGFIAARLGYKPDAKELAEEVAHLQRELTIEALGPDSLPDERKHQRITEQTSRRWQLTQQVRTASQETAKQAQQRKQVVEHIGAIGKEAADAFPHLSDASEFFADPYQTALDLWMHEVKAGRVQVTGDDGKDVREALRLLNDHVKTKLDRVKARQPKDTAPAPATAPAQASTKEAAPGAPAPQPSTAPVKGSASPKTLSATQAAAAPVVKTREAPPERKPAGPITIDPHDRDGRERRLRDHAQRLAAKKK